MNLTEILNSAYDDAEIVTETTCHGHIKHLYEDYKMTFGEMKQIFKDVFSGKTILHEKCDGMGLLVTYKDGEFCFARNKKQLKEPLNISKLCSYYEGKPLVKEAFVNSANNLQKALSSLDSQVLNRIFANGQNYANVEIVYPPCRNVMDYGNRCIIQLNGIDQFDSDYNKISEDSESTKWLYEQLKTHKALKQEMFEIEESRVLRMKDSVSAEKAYEQLMEDFNKVIDGYSTKCTIQDYANERLSRYIINVCNHNNIEVDRDCTFVKELADRIGYFSGRRPTKSDICTFAKRAGINVRGEEYKKLMETVDSQREMINEEVLRPVENLVMKAGTLLLRNLTGFMSADPQNTSKKLVNELEHALYEVEKDNCKLTADKLKLFKKNIKKINEWQDRYMPSEGVIVKIKGINGCTKTYKITGAFGAVNQIMNILKYK